MTDNHTFSEASPKSLLRLMIIFLVTTILSLLFAVGFHKTWVENLDFFHTVLELVCIFIALSIFLSVWYTFQHHGSVNFILGFGYLTVALFDAFHAYFYLKLDLNLSSYYDLSTRFWIMGRITEALTLLLSIKKYEFKKNKWAALAVALGSFTIIALLATQYHDILPVLLTAEGVTPLKVVLEYVVIAVYLLGLFRLKGLVGRQSSNLTYPYIFLAMLSSIAAEFIFTLYNSTTSTLWTMGHSLKIVSYFFLLHGVFISSIIYPYKKLEQSHNLLEQKNEMLVRDHEKLLQQEKLALLGQLGAGIVHETRNYLTTIKGSTQLIFHFSQDEKIKKHAKTIDNNVNEVNKILSEFLFLSRPRETELAQIPLSHLFNSIKSIVETASMLKGIPVEFHLAEKELRVLCDEAQLKQVILNLCKNAAEAMSEKPDARLVIETGLVKDQKEMFIRISDNGRGISEENIAKLGTPFFTTKRSGTGLGLNVCYKIIENHRGRISVQSKLNKGTTFTICLPCVETGESPAFVIVPNEG